MIDLVVSVMGGEGEYLLLGLGCLETEYSSATHETESRPCCLICENLAITLMFLSF